MQTDDGGLKELAGAIGVRGETLQVGGGATTTCPHCGETVPISEVTLTVGGGAETITLRPPSLATQCELAEGKWKSEARKQFWLAWKCAQRGGYKGSDKDFLELLEGDDSVRIGEAIDRLCPLMARAGQRLLDLMASPAAADAEPGTEPSGDF